MSDQQNQGTGRPLPISKPSTKNERVLELSGEMGRRFEIHCGAGTWTDPDYRQDAAMWAAAWRARAAQPISEQGSDRVLTDEEIDAIAAQLVCVGRLPGTWIKQWCEEIGYPFARAVEARAALASSERAPEPSDPSPAQDASQLD